MSSPVSPVVGSASAFPTGSPAVRATSPSGAGTQGSNTTAAAIGGTATVGTNTTITPVGGPPPIGGSWILGALVALLGGAKDPKLQEALLMALAALARENGGVAGVLGRGGECLSAFLALLALYRGFLLSLCLFVPLLFLTSGSSWFLAHLGFSLILLSRSCLFIGLLCFPIFFVPRPPSYLAHLCYFPCSVRPRVHFESRPLFVLSRRVLPYFSRVAFFFRRRSTSSVAPAAARVRVPSLPVRVDSICNLDEDLRP